MKKNQSFIPYIIPVILLLIITDCKKTDKETSPTKSITTVSVNDSALTKGDGALPSINSFSIPKTKAFPITVPPVVLPPLGGPPTIFNPTVTNGNIITAPSATNSLLIAKLNGIVNANYLPTKVTFEYGRVSLIGTNSISIFNISLAANPNIAITGHVNTPVYASTQQLLTNTTYRFRIKAVNSLGTVYSNSVLFTTMGHFIGEKLGGGLVFYIDKTGQHGLVAASGDQGTYAYFAGNNTITNKTGATIGTGYSNTKIIVAAQGPGSYAARICVNLVLNGYSDWFLPSQAELYLMYSNLKKVGLGNFSNGYYWSSTEYGNGTTALAQTFINGLQTNSNKSFVYKVRAVRAF